MWMTRALILLLRCSHAVFYHFRLQPRSDAPVECFSVVSAYCVMLHRARWLFSLASLHSPWPTYLDRYAGCRGQIIAGWCSIVLPSTVSNVSKIKKVSFQNPSMTMLYPAWFSFSAIIHESIHVVES